MNKHIYVEVLSFGLLVFLLYILFLNNSYGMTHYNNMDIHRGFQRGIDVLNGVNSYKAFNPSNMLTQEKVPGFFPMYFLLMAVLAGISNSSFVIFVDVLRYFVFFTFVGLSSLIYMEIRKSNKPFALLLISIFMFNRWTLNNLFDLKQEAYVLFLTILSLLQLRSKNHQNLSFLLFGFATAIKHLTVFLFPIYFFFLFKLKNLKKAIILTLLFLAPIILPVIPYIIDSPKHMLGSIFFNVTREAEPPIPSELGLQNTGFDKILILYNQDRINGFLLFLPRLPMLALMASTVFIFFKEKIDMWIYACLIYLIFISFNPTLFSQYFVWFMVFVPFALIQVKLDNHG